MVVDDDADVRDALRDYVEGLGCAVVAAVDGVHALECLESCPPPCLVLLDLNMPRLDGEGFVRRVRADGCHCGLAIASMTAERHRSQPEMTVAHLHKPFDLDDLERIIRGFCREPDAGACSRGL
jgi:CheY-like chemotaxis protein